MIRLPALLPWLVGGALALSTFTGIKGYRLGTERAEARHADAEARTAENLRLVADRASEAEAARLALEAERDALALELEDAARADPDASRPALGPDSVRRLNRQ